MWQQLCVRLVAEDVDCSSGSCISEYTAEMDGELENSG